MNAKEALELKEGMSKEFKDNTQEESEALRPFLKAQILEMIPKLVRRDSYDIRFGWKDLKTFRKSRDIFLRRYTYDELSDHWKKSVERIIDEEMKLLGYQKYKGQSLTYSFDPDLD